MPDINEYLPVNAAAKRLGISRQALYEAISRRSFTPIDVYGAKWLAVAEIEAYERRTRPDGAKPRGRPKATQETSTPNG